MNASQIIGPGELFEEVAKPERKCEFKSGCGGSPVSGTSYCIDHLTKTDLVTYLQATTETLRLERENVKDQAAIIKILQFDKGMIHAQWEECRKEIKRLESIRPFHNLFTLILGALILFGMAVALKEIGK